jgi:cytochrome oxidase Cu insertion factor (SCO1/SenC/PrrC family)
MSRCILTVLAGALAAAALFSGGCSRKSHSKPLEVIQPLNNFSLVDQEGRTVSLKDLRGKVWVASFIFTRCAGPCSRVSASMAQLQSELAGQDGVALVSFTVDPGHDTPKVLKEYAARYGADPKRWCFLTGDKNTVYNIIRTNFLVAVEEATGKARKPGYQVTHSTKLALVDKRAQLRAYYDGTDPEQVKELRHAVAQLAREEP